MLLSRLISLRIKVIYIIIIYARSFFIWTHFISLYKLYTSFTRFGSVKSFFFTWIIFEGWKVLRIAINREQATMWTERTFNDFISFNIREPSSVPSQKFKFHIATLHILTTHIFFVHFHKSWKISLYILKERIYFKIIKISHFYF